MIFKRSRNRYADTPQPVTPYQKAAQVWDRRMGDALAHARNWRLAAFGSTRRKLTAPAVDPNLQALLAAETPVVTLVGKSWDLHVTQALRIADRGYVIVHGKIEFEGSSADELNNNDLIRQFYLGM